MKAFADPPDGAEEGGHANFPGSDACCRIFPGYGFSHTFHDSPGWGAICSGLLPDFFKARKESATRCHIEGQGI
jgi:hypothetical protein